MSARRVKKNEDTKFLAKRARLSSPDGKARILVVDDHPLVRHGINMLLNRQDDLVCCQDEVDTVAGIIPAIKKEHPQMLLLDLNLKDGNALNIIGTLRDQFPDMPVLVISQFDNMLCAEDALRAGAVGYVMKEEATHEILTAIRTVLQKGTYISHKLSLPVSDPAAAQASQRPAVVEHLAEGELQVFLLLGSGVPLSDVAGQMKISAQTLETYCKNLKDKLNLTNDTALVNYALQCKRSFDTNNVDVDAALFHCALQLERCERGISPQPKPAQPKPPSGFSGKPS
jgi:DNA-binding NarL/FixJ family response regulator